MQIIRANYKPFYFFLANFTFTVCLLGDPILYPPCHLLNASGALSIQDEILNRTPNPELVPPWLT